MSVTNVLNTKVSFTKCCTGKELGGVTYKGGCADSVHGRQPDGAKVDQNDVLRLKCNLSLIHGFRSRHRNVTILVSPKKHEKELHALELLVRQLQLYSAFLDTQSALRSMGGNNV